MLVIIDGTLFDVAARQNQPQDNNQSLLKSSSIEKTPSMENAFWANNALSWLKKWKMLDWQSALGIGQHDQADPLFCTIVRNLGFVDRLKTVPRESSS